MNRIVIVVAVLCGLAAVPVRAQEDEGGSGGAGLSRPMRVAVQFYEQGEDIQAMDRFMEILTKGDPSERSMANEYINLITHRMNASGGKAGAPAPQAGVSVAEPVNPGVASPIKRADPAAAARVVPETIADGEAARGRTAPRFDSIDDDSARSSSRKKAAAPRARADDMPAANKALMRKEIHARLRSAVEKSLIDVKSVDGVRVVMRENGDPEAIGIPTPLLFQTGIAFQNGASKILDPLTKLVFALGTTSAVILPEGTAIGDAKVMDMRRTMGISAHFFNAGVAPPRVRVNLLNTQVDIPKGLLDFKGVVIVFVYNQPLSLVVESAVGDELGPPISLGVYPPSFRPARGQGVIIEFSVSDPPAGLVSWKFQLLQPSRDGTELAPLQDVVGGGPVFHQIFWNGKQNYFGESLPAGRYECVLTALDAKNRQRSLHRWISVVDDSPSEKLLADAPPGGATKVEAIAAAAASAEKPAAAAASAHAPSADMAGTAGKPLVAGVTAAPRVVELAPRAPAPRAKRGVVKRPVRGKKAGKADTGKANRTGEPKAAAAPAPSAEETAAAEEPPAEKPAEKKTASKPGATEWSLSFNKDTYQLTPEAEKLLATAAAAVPTHPLENLKVTGHSAAAEANGEALAGQRAKMVAGILVNRYQVDSKRIFMSSAASGAGSKVDLTFARTE
ncbi:MAG: OmpA family protein [Elusimicrobia bacterium]|nr:OmpA family protein [Elusimicrobiota bacterium]